MTETHTVTVTLWVWYAERGPASWNFQTIEGEAAKAIHALKLLRRLEGGRQRRWGLMKVQGQIGDTEWKTSIFPVKQKRQLAAAGQGGSTQGRRTDRRGCIGIPNSAVAQR